MVRSEVCHNALPLRVTIHSASTWPDAYCFVIAKSACADQVRVRPLELIQFALKRFFGQLRIENRQKTIRLRYCIGAANRL